jgi:hypothetical protein
MNSIFNRRAGLTLAVLAALGLAGTAAQAQPFTPGDLVISVIGDGTATLASTGNSVFVDDLSITTGTLVGSPINTGLIDSGTATSDGFLTLSANGQLLTIQGYQPGYTGTTSVTSSADARGVSEIGASGAVTTSFFSDTTYAGNNIRSSATIDGSTVYLGGSATNAADAGIRSTAFGSGTSTQLESAPTTNTRNVNIFGGNVYYSTGSAGPGIYSLGAVGATGTPSLIAADAAGSPYDFYFANATTLFVADDSSSTKGGGLQEYTDSGSGFTLANTFNQQGGLRSLAGNGTDIFGITTAGSGSVVDFNILSGNFSTLYTNTTTNTVIRGVDFAPVAAGAPVPEASTTISFGLLLALGLGGFAVAKKRTVRA